VAFIKWYESDPGEIRAHWHLSPASPRVVRRVTRLVEIRTGEAPQRVELYRSTTEE
jgi:hypothetical protein